MPRPQSVAGKSSAISCLVLMLATCLSLASFGCGGGASQAVSPQSGQLSIQPASVSLSTTGRQCHDGHDLVEWIVQGSGDGSVRDDHDFGDGGGECGGRVNGDRDGHRQYFRPAHNFAVDGDGAATRDAAVSGFRSGERQRYLVGESNRGR